MNICLRNLDLIKLLFVWFVQVIKHGDIKMIEGEGFPVHRGKLRLPDHSKKLDRLFETNCMIDYCQDLAAVKTCFMS